MSKITLVIPAYNEKQNIGPFLNRCQDVEKESGHRFSYVFIDDGSGDGTFDEISRLAGSNSNIRGIKFSRNFGKEAGILAGLRECVKDYNSQHEYTVIIDADLQQDPKYVVQMANFLDNNPDYDCVACYQKDRKESGFMKFMKKRFYKMIDESSDTHFEENVSDFRMMRMEMVEAVLQLGEYHRFSKGIFSWVGFNTYYMPYEVEERLHGTTTWTFSKLFKYGVDGIIGFSTAPLRASTWLGIITSVVALVLLLYSVIKTIAFGRDVPGFATIVCLILIMGGVQMILLGIMGEYISRIFMESKKRPIYIVKDTIGISKDNSFSNNRFDKTVEGTITGETGNRFSDADSRTGFIINDIKKGEEVPEVQDGSDDYDNTEFKWEKI